MSPIAGIKGMRHVALKVKDIFKAKAFYQGTLGMEVVWEPDPQNVYLTSGCDNIALHQVTPSSPAVAAGQQLDHLGFRRLVHDRDEVRHVDELALRVAETVDLGRPRSRRGACRWTRGHSS